MILNNEYIEFIEQSDIRVGDVISLVMTDFVPGLRYCKRSKRASNLVPTGPVANEIEIKYILVLSISSRNRAGWWANFDRAQAGSATYALKILTPEGDLCWILLYESDTGIVKCI